MNAPARPMLRYHGGKWRLATWIIRHLPEHRVYVEPYGGAASVLLRKPRSYAEVYNDLDGDVVNLFRVARDRGDELREALRLTPFARDEFALAYEPTGDEIERARRTVIRSFMGFGSNAHNRRTGFRSNCTRARSTPARDWLNYPSCLSEIVQRLQGVVIENRNALDVIRTHDGEETLHYVDPPYVLSTRDRGKDYGHEMDDDDHAELAAVLRAVRGRVVLSGYASPLYEELYAGWHRVEKAALADGAQPRTEVLWLSPQAAEVGLFA